MPYPERGCIIRRLIQTQAVGHTDKIFTKTLSFARQINCRLLDVLQSVLVSLKNGRNVFCMSNRLNLVETPTD